MKYIMASLFVPFALAAQTHPHLFLARVDYEEKSVSGMTEEYKDDHSAPAGVHHNWVIEVMGERMRDDKGEVRGFEDPSEKKAVFQGFVETRAIMEGAAGTTIRALILSPTTFEFEAWVANEWVKWEVTREGVVQGRGRDPLKLEPAEFDLVARVHEQWTRYLLESVMWWRDGRGVAISKPVRKG